MRRLFVLATLAPLAWFVPASAELNPKAVAPPKAQQKPHVQTLHGETLADPYYWLRDDARTNPEVLAYLKAENAYHAQHLAPVKPLEDQIYNEIIALRPDWHSEDDEKGTLKIVMTGSASDPIEWQAHIRNKPRREALAKRFKNPQDPLKIVLVRDMWLTGFDAPCLHTMYRTSRCGATG